MTAVYILLAAFVASFIGSMQVGPMNLTVIKTCINKNFRAAVWVAVGGNIAEFVYATMAIYGTSLIKNNIAFFKLLDYGIVLILMVLSIYSFIKANKKPAIFSNGTTSGDFLKGLSLGIFNPQLFPFWVAVLIYVRSFGLFELDTTLNRTFFIAGAILGGFALSFSLARLAHTHKSTIINKLGHTKMNRFFGWFFMALALLKIVELYAKS